MNISSETGDIINIAFGHDSEGYATRYLIEHKDSVVNIDEVIKAHNNGFEDGVRWLASLLGEFGLSVELHDEKIKPTPFNEWYSGIKVYR